MWWKDWNGFEVGYDSCEFDDDLDYENWLVRQFEQIKEGIDAEEN